MNKLAKGAIAAGIGTALFLGGSTTLALWNDSANIASSENINSGKLKLEASKASWSSNPDKWVPGDFFTYTSIVTITAEGDNIHAQLKIDPTTIDGDDDLKAALKYSITVADVTGGKLTKVKPDVYDVAPTDPKSATPMTAKVTVRVEFPTDAVEKLVAQGQTVTLTKLQLVLNQTTASTAPTTP